MNGRKNAPSDACEGSFCLFSSPGLQAGVNGGVSLQAASAALSVRLQPLPEPMAKVNGGVSLQAASAALSVRLQPLPEPMAKAPFEKPAEAGSPSLRHTATQPFRAGPGVSTFLGRCRRS